MASPTSPGKPFQFIDRKNRKGPLQHRCEYCKTVAHDVELIRCQNCSCVRYCDEEHARAHIKDHCLECEKVMKAVSDIQGTQREIFELLGDTSGDERQDREQMEFLRIALQSEHCVLVEILADVDTLDAYNKVLETGCRYLTLYPADEDGVHYQMAIAMLQLNLDQPCLDFMLWWSMNEGFQKGTEKWRDPSKMHMSGMKADIFERLTFNDVAHHHPVFLSIVILIKLKLAIDLKNIYLTWRLLESSKLPSELSRLIMKQIPRSALSERFLYVDLHVVRTAMQELSKQASQLGQVLHRVDPNLSVALLRNRNMLKSLRRRKKQSQGNTGNEYADRMAAEYSNVSMVYCAFQQTDEVFQILRMADKLCSERSMLVINEDPWGRIIEVFDAMLLLDV